MNTENLCLYLLAMFVPLSFQLMVLTLRAMSYSQTFSSNPSIPQCVFKHLLNPYIIATLTGVTERGCEAGN